MIEVYLANYLWTLSICILIFLIDDLFIDCTALIKRLGPTPISQKALYDRENKKNLAVMIANWKEEDVLEAMVNGNMSRLDQDNVHLFLGVYPNDSETLCIALKMDEKFERVHAVINCLPGPTYKGQMLNEVIRYIFEKEEDLGLIFEGFILHDSEDVLDPRIPYLYSLGLRQADFIQTPVLSLPVSSHELTAGTYMDEFAEIHTKDLLVREYFGAAIPSAGVGTCLSRRLVLMFLSRQNGEVFLPDSLTEDYQIGLQASLWGLKSRFLCYYMEDERPTNVIATKEYFPHVFWHSVRQKTRWTTGIAFQGNANFGWFGNIYQLYFLWRDRKGPYNAFLTLNIFLILGVTPFVNTGELPSSSGLSVIFTLNTFGMLARFFVRFSCVHKIYGKVAAFGVFIRWPSAMLINMFSGLRSTQQYMESSVTGEKIKWVKTQHRLPENFGLPPAVGIMPPVQQSTTKDELQGDPQQYRERSL